MKNALVIAGLIIALSTAAFSQQEGPRSTTRRSTTTAKKQSGSATTSKKSGSKKSGRATKNETVSTSSTTADGSTGTNPVSTARRQAPATAQPTTTAYDVTPAQGDVEANKVEKWYGYAAIGYANHNYPGALGTAMTRHQNNPTVSNTSVAMDLAGVYVPYGGTHLLVGGVVSLSTDAYSRDEEWATVNQATIASSAVYFVDRIGEGFFLRGDIGLAAMTIAHSISAEKYESPVGIGTLAGAGYALPVSSEIDLMLNMNYSARFVDSETFGTFGATVGILF